MGVWQELRCDNRNEDVDDCISHEFWGPKLMNANDAKDVARGRTSLIVEAKGEGQTISLKCGSDDV